MRCRIARLLSPSIPLYDPPKYPQSNHPPRQYPTSDTRRVSPLHGILAKAQDDPQRLHRSKQLPPAHSLALLPTARPRPSTHGCIQWSIQCEYQAYASLRSFEEFQGLHRSVPQAPFAATVKNVRRAPSRLRRRGDDKTSLSKLEISEVR